MKSPSAVPHIDLELPHWPTGPRTLHLLNTEHSRYLIQMGIEKTPLAQIFLKARMALAAKGDKLEKGESIMTEAFKHMDNETFLLYLAILVWGMCSYHHGDDEEVMGSRTIQVKDPRTTKVVEQTAPIEARLRNILHSLPFEEGERNKMMRLVLSAFNKSNPPEEPEVEGLDGEKATRPNPTKPGRPAKKSSTSSLKSD